MLLLFFCCLLLAIAYLFVAKQLTKLTKLTRRQFYAVLFLPLVIGIFYLMLGEPNFQQKKLFWDNLIHQAEQRARQQPSNKQNWLLLAEIYDRLGLVEKRDEILAKYQEIK